MDIGTNSQTDSLGLPDTYTEYENAEHFFTYQNIDLFHAEGLPPLVQGYGSNFWDILYNLALKYIDSRIKYFLDPTKT